MATTFDSISAPRGGRSVAGYGTYDQAQHAIDHLSDNGFPVENADIIGSDLRLVEHVTGRITTGRAALAGAGTGAWLGLFFGLLVGLFTTGPTWVGLLLGGLVIGAVWGAIFGFFAQWRPAGGATSPPSGASSPVGTTSSSQRRTASARAPCSPGSTSNTLT